MRRHTLSAALFLAALLHQGAALGQGAVSSPLEQAKAQFELGAQAYSSARYDVAVSAFDEAYRLLPRPEILFSLAQAEKKQCVVMKDAALLKKALGHYRDYYGQVQTAGRKAEAAEAIGYLEQLATQPDFGGAATPGAAQKVQTKLSVYASVDGAHVYVDGRSQGDVPFVGAVSPGKHVVAVRLDGYIESEREVFVTEGTTQTLPVTLAERPVAVTFETGAGPEVFVDGRFVGKAPLPEGFAITPGGHTVVAVKNGRRLVAREVTVERSKPMVVRLPLEISAQRVAAYATGGLGIAALVASGVFYGVALAEEARAQNRDAMREKGTLDATGLDQYNTALSNRNAFRAAATASALGGVIALGGGILLFAFDRPDPNSVPIRSPEKPKAKPKDFDVAVLPVLSGGVYGLGATGRF